MTLDLPMPPNLANSRMHWRVKHREKLAYWATLDRMQLTRVLPPPPAVPWPHARLTSTMTLWAAMDDDNAMARHKWALDWLVTRGYLAGDTRKCLTWTGLPQQIVTRKTPPTLSLALETAS